MSLLDSISGLLGGSPNGSNFVAQQGANPQGTNIQGANIVAPVGAGQAQQAYGQTQQGLSQQQQLINAIQAQNGLQNQSSVYNQMQGVANGTGPNPAQAMLAQSTGANTANQAALMASQRGVGANPGMIARQAAQQGAANQQNAAGQAATLQANQSLNALGQMGSIANQQASNQMGAVQNYNQAAQAQQAAMLGAINNQNQANVTNQGNLNQANVGMQSNINNNNTSMASNMNSTNESMAQANAANSAKGIGGLLSGAAGLGLMAATGGLSAAGPALLGATAGKYKGGEVENPKLAAVAKKDRYPDHIQGMADIYHGSDGGSMPMYSQGGEVPIIVSPGEKILNPKEAESVAEGKQNPMRVGEKVPGKAKVKGDSPVNDTVPTKAEGGSVVLPKSVMESDDPEKEAALFVKAHLKKNSKGKEHGDFKSALKKAMMERKSK